MSDKNSSSSSTGGIGFVGLLTIVFITLKLLGKITWSWVWVLSPMWISISLGLVVLGGIGLLALGGSLMVYLLDRPKPRKQLNRPVTRIITPSEDERRNTYLN